MTMAMFNFMSKKKISGAHTLTHEKIIKNTVATIKSK